MSEETEGFNEGYELGLAERRAENATLTEQLRDLKEVAQRFMDASENLNTGNQESVNRYSEAHTELEAVLGGDYEKV